MLPFSITFDENRVVFSWRLLVRAQVVQAGSSSTRCSEAQLYSRARGFTLVDVLVTMTVIAILIGILLPSLSSVRETAHQIVCRSNVRQLAIGIAMYAEANADSIPRTGTIPVLNGPNNQNSSYNTLTLRFGGTQGAIQGWDGLGLLYAEEYTAAPKVYYCPSHTGEHPYRAFAEAWATDGVTIAGNFQYRGQGPTGNAGQPMTNRIDRIRPSGAIVADGLRSQSEFNHKIGANVMRADISVSWFNDSARSVSSGLAKDSEYPTESQIQEAWNDLDNPASH